MLVVGAAATVGSIAGAAAGAAFAKTQYEKIVLELRNQNENRSKNFDKQLKAVEEKYSSVIEKSVKENEKLEEEKTKLEEEKAKLEEEKIELIRKFNKNQQEILNFMKAAEEKHQKMEQERNEMRLQQDMILSFLNVHPALQPAGPSNSGAQTVTEGLSGATGIQGLHGANDHMSTSQFSIVADFSDEDTEVVPDPQNPGPYINWLTALNYSKDYQASNIAAEFSDDDIEVILDPNSQVDQPMVSSTKNLSK